MLQVFVGIIQHILFLIGSLVMTTNASLLFLFVGCSMVGCHCKLNALTQQLTKGGFSAVSGLHMYVPHIVVSGKGCPRFMVQPRMQPTSYITFACPSGPIICFQGMMAIQSFVQKCPVTKHFTGGIGSTMTVVLLVSFFPLYYTRCDSMS
jgi:hypothetical protein